MERHLVTVWMLFACSAGTAADYVLDRKAATELAQTGKHEQALTAYIKMSEGEVTDFQKADALEQAALCANRLQRYDRAMELAQQIPLEPMSKTCQMRIMADNRRWQELVASFGEENIDAWPDFVKGDAFYARGRAFYNRKDGTGAAQDLRKAADYLMEDNSKGLALNTLGDTYQHLLKDDERAIEVYRQVYSTRNVYKQCHAAMAVASIYQRREQTEAALQELARIPMDRVTLAYWRGAMLNAWGSNLASAGRKAEAIARYNEALQLEGISDWTKKACEHALNELQTDAK